jgi:hypothetical protein
MKKSVLRLVVTLAGALLGSAQLSARIVNVSTRGLIGWGEQSLVTGFVVAGETPKTVLVRGVGPGLADFGATNAAAAVKVALHDASGTIVAQNDGYQNNADLPALEQLSLETGAFALHQAGDSALVATVGPGSYTVVLSAGGNGAALGLALAEVYDTDASDSGSAIVNLSGRGMVGAAGDSLITGFVIDGNSSHSVLLRGVGRDLAQYGVAKPAAAVGFNIYGANGLALASTQPFAPRIEASASIWDAAAAFPMTDLGGSTTVVELAPGAYTMAVEPSGQNSDRDIGLLEVYDGGAILAPPMETPAPVATTPPAEIPAEVPAPVAPATL